MSKRHCFFLNPLGFYVNGSHLASSQSKKTEALKCNCVEQDEVEGPERTARDRCVEQVLLISNRATMGVNPGGDGGDMSPPPSEGCPPPKKITLSIVKNICMYT